MSDHLPPANADFPLDLTVTLWGATPDEIRANALEEAAQLFGAVPLVVVSAVVEADPESRGRYIGTAVFRHVVSSR